MRRERKARIVVGLLLLIFIIGPLVSGGIDLLVDWIWFGQEGYRVIYLTILKSQITLSTLAGLGFMAVAALNLLLARRLAGQHGFRVYGETVDFPLLDRFRAAFLAMLWLGVLVIGYIMGEWASTNWRATRPGSGRPIRFSAATWASTCSVCPSSGFFTTGCWRR